MKFVFFGTPEFAATVLEKLIAAGMPPALLVANPDRPVGRKKIITPPPVKQLIARLQDCKIAVWQPEKLEIRNWELEINKLGGLDFCVVAAYGKIIPKSILDTMPAKFVGVHPSLLPKYRGATPIQSVILAGEEKTGVTLYLMDEQVDHGPILAKREWEIRNSKYEILNRELAELAGGLLIETIPKFMKGEYTLRRQNDKEATYTKKFSDEEGFVDLEKDDPAVVERKVRALNPEPGVWTYARTLRQYWEVRPPHEYKRVKILEAELIDGRLKLKKIQFEGKKPQIL